MYTPSYTRIIADWMSLTDPLLRPRLGLAVKPLERISSVSEERPSCTQWKWTWSSWWQRIDMEQCVLNKEYLHSFKVRRIPCIVIRYTHIHPCIVISRYITLAWCTFVVVVLANAGSHPDLCSWAKYFPYGYSTTMLAAHLVMVLRSVSSLFFLLSASNSTPLSASCRHLPVLYLSSAPISGYPLPHTVLL